MSPEKAALLEALSVERQHIERPAPTARTRAEPPPEWTSDEQAEHREALLLALSDDPVVVAFRERLAS